MINAKSNEYIALVNYANTIRTALKDVDDALAAVVSAQLTEESQQRTLTQARRSYELAQIELREGSGSEQERLDAQRSLFSAQDSVLSARVSRPQRRADLVPGSGWRLGRTRCRAGVSSTAFPLAGMRLQRTSRLTP